MVDATEANPSTPPNHSYEFMKNAVPHSKSKEHVTKTLHTPHFSHILLPYKHEKCRSNKENLWLKPRITRILATSLVPPTRKNAIPIWKMKESCD